MPTSMKNGTSFNKVAVVVSMLVEYVVMNSFSTGYITINMIKVTKITITPTNVNCAFLPMLPPQKQFASRNSYEVC